MRAWNTTPSSRNACVGSRATGWPSTEMLPCRVSYSRVINENSVVLPAPFNPSSAVNRPCGTAKLTSSSAFRGP